VEVVGIVEGQPERRGDETPDRGLAGACDTHDHDEHRHKV
jgi:hypothetical protein